MWPCQQNAGAVLLSPGDEGSYPKRNNGPVIAACQPMPVPQLWPAAPSLGDMMDPGILD